MDALIRLLHGIRSLFTRQRMESDLADELRYHIELETEKNIREGMNPKEARRKALLDFGGVERFKERTREVRPSRPVEDFLRDLRYAGRRLPGVAGERLGVLGHGSLLPGRSDGYRGRGP